MKLGSRMKLWPIIPVSSCFCLGILVAKSSHQEPASSTRDLESPWEEIVRRLHFLPTDYH